MSLRWRGTLGVLVQVGAVRAAFWQPRWFWAAMTTALVSSGVLTAPGRPRPRLRADPGWIAGGVMAGLCAYLVTFGTGWLLNRSSPGRRWLSQVRRCTDSRPRALRALLVVPAAVGEELFWREAMLGDGSQGLLQSGPEVAVYAAVQLASGNPAVVGGGVLLGLVTTCLRVGSGSLTPALLAHLVFSEMTLTWPGLPLPHPCHHRAVT